MRVARLAGVLAITAFLWSVAPAYADRAFAPRFSTTDRGSTTLAGNTVLTCTTVQDTCAPARNGTGSVGNDQLAMINVDIDGDSATFNSSRAVLTIPSGATVLFAGLYWGGDTAAGSFGFAAPNAANRNIVRLTTPAASAQTVTASVVDTDSVTGTRYQAFADITSQVSVSGGGTYTVGNVQTGTGLNRHGGWGLVVAYRLASEPFRRLRVYDGFLALTPTVRTAVDVQLSGFLTPASGTVKGRLGVVAYEGDRNLVTDAATLGGKALVDSANPAGNFFNGSRSLSGAAVTTGNPTYANTLGLDADDLNIDGVLGNGVSSTTFTATTTQDTYLLGALALATDESPPVNTAAPAVSGTTTEGNVLSASTGTWTGTPTITYAYRWQRCNAAGTGCADISGATGATYTPGAADVGSRLRVVVTATNAAGSASANSATTAVIAADPPETTITSGPSGLTNTATPTFTFASDETGSTFHCRVDNAAFTPCASPFTTAALADGQHTFEVRAIDLASALDPTPATRTFTVDATAPDTTITAGPSGAVNTATPSFSFTSTETGATFECRIDAGAWAACSSPRAVATMADGQHTFEVRSIDAAGNTDGTPAARTFTVDTRAPETTTTGGPSGPTSNNRATIAFSADETGATFQCRVDGGAWASCTSPFATAALSDGAHTVEVRATDAAGNTDATPAARTFTVDTAAPATSIDSGPSGATPTATPTFTFSSTEAGATFQCRIDGGAFAACSSPFTTPSLADGSHTLEVRAVDAAGNVDATPETRTFRVDTAPPDTTIGGGPTGTTEDPTPTFEFTSNDTAATFQCRVDAGAFAACISPYTTTELANGQHTFAVRAIDAAGNVDATPAARTFTVAVPPPDADAPQTTIDSGPGAVTADSTPDVAFSANEPSTFQCRVDGAAFAPCSSPLTLGPLGDGQHTFEVRATDTAGNVDATPAARTFVVDTRAPETVLTTAPPAATDDATPTFAFDADEHPTTFQCRIDGGAFAACSSPFTAAALADGEHTFEVRAVDAAGNVDASPAARTFTVDTAAPETTISSGPTGSANDATPAFTFTSSESGARFECRVDGGAFAACDSPHTTAELTDGQHTFEVRAIDPAGNPDATPAARTFMVDTAAPQTAITSAPGPLTNDATPDLAFTSSEPGSTFECRVDGAAFAPCSSPLTLSSLADGEHTVEVRATDAAGNSDTTPAARVFRVDTDPPETTITSGPSGLTADASPAFAFTSDEPGSTFQCRVDGGAFTACDSPLRTSDLAEGAHTVEVRATDAAGNPDPTPSARSFVVDTTGPGTTIETGPTGTTGDATPTFTFSADEPDATFHCRVDGAPFADCASPLTTTSLGDGQHTFAVRAVDAAGNADATPATRTFTVDTTAPQTAVARGPTGLIADPTPTYELESDEPGATFECRVDDGAFAACASPYTTPALPDGQHTIQFRAVDAAGNADPTPASRIVTVDADPPDTAITRGPSGLIADATPTFEFDADEPDSTFECRVDGAPFATCESPYTTAALADGTHTIEVRAIDRAGNPDPTPASRTVTVDTSGPQTTIVAGPAGPTTDATPEFQFTADEPGATFECRVDGAPFAACTSPFEVTPALADGQHTFQVRAVDGAGNADDSPAERTLTVDTTAPAATITAGPEGATGDTTPTFEFASGDPDATFECRVDAAAFAPCTSPHTTAVLGDGEHTFEVRAVDAVGNVGAPAARTFVVDTVVPETVIDNGPSGATNDPTPTFTFSSSDPTVQFQCSIDGGAFTACEAPFTTPALPAGQHTIAVRAVDPAGNADGDPAERTFTVDTEPPQTDITGGPAATTGDPTATFTFTGGDRFECRVDDGEFTLCQSPYTTPSLANGAHTFEVRAIDAAGNTDATPASSTFTVAVPPPDADAPVTAIDQGPGAVTNDTTPSFSFSANEAATFECRIDGGAYAACTPPFTSPALADGQHTFEVRATDSASNVDATPEAYSFLVDTAAPSTQISEAPPATTNDPTPTFAFEASEPGATFECRVDGASFAPCASPVTSPPLADGPHTFEVRAIDAAGNPDPAPASHPFTVDTAAPDTTLDPDTGPTGLTDDPTPTFAFSGDPDARLECSVDDQPFAPCASPFTTDPLADGGHTFAVRAVDAAGNRDLTPATRSFIVDTEAPNTTIDSGPQAPQAATTATFTFSAELGAQFECRVDSGAFVGCASPFETEPLADGPHTFEVRAIDAAGNTDPSPAVRTFTLDNAAPATTITSGPPSVTPDATPTFAFTADEPGATFRCRIDDGAFASCDSPFTADALADGSHTFEVFAVDAAGNAESAPARRAFRVDALTPQTQITSGPVGPTADATPTFEFAAGEPSAFECRIDEAAFAPCTSPFTSEALADGAHTFAVRAIDDAGNRDGTPPSRTFTIDTNAPQTTITGGPSGPIKDATPTFAMTSSEPGSTFRCQIDDAPPAPCTSPFAPSSPLADGPHTITIVAVDAAGNPDPNPSTRSIVVDTQPPDTRITGGPAGLTADTTPTFTFEAAEAGAALECRIDTGDWESCTSPFTPTPLTDGNHTFEVRAVDAAGNPDPEPAVQPFQVESRAPNTIITSGPTGTSDPTPTFRFTADEPDAHYECRIVDEAFAACAAPYTMASLPDGTYVLEVRAIDAAGNVDPTPATWTFTVKRTVSPAPTPTPTPPAPGAPRAACEDAVDNDGDGLADAFDPGCLSGSGGAYAPNDRNETDDVDQLPAPQLALRCSRANLRLIDVRQVGRRVRITGGARPRYIGQTVSIIAIPGNAPVASVKVGRAGGFATTVPKPRRVTNKTFYGARIGTSVKAKRVKLKRRTVLTTAKVIRGRVVIRGRLVRPLLKTRQTVVIRREISCNRRVVVGRTRTDRKGAFRVILKRPARVRAAIYLTSSRVRHGGFKNRRVRTNSLPTPIPLH